MAVTTETVIAANRFGLGARPGDLADIGDNPREWLLDQVREPRPLLKSVGRVPTSKEAILIQLEHRQKNRDAMQGSTRTVAIISTARALRVTQQIKSHQIRPTPTTKI